MATAINSAQIRDGTVSRADLNLTTVGQSVIAKIVQGTFMSVTSTGADAGTGDVTLNVNIPTATISVSGLMSATDKTSFNAIPTTYISLVSTTQQNMAGSLSTKQNFTFVPPQSGSPAILAPYSAGIVAENFGNGLLLDFGANYEQLAVFGTVPYVANPAMFGAYFRIDTRDAQASEMFSVSAIPTGTGTSQTREQKVFRVDRTGNMFSTVNGYAVATSNNFATVIPAVTTSVNGLMLAADKARFNNTFDTVFGNQTDATGTVTLDGTTTVLGLAPVTSGYTLLSDIQVFNLVINVGVTLFTNGFRIFCAGTLTNNGTIFRKGGNSTGATAVTATGIGTLANQIIGTNGVVTTTVGSVGYNISANSNSLCSNGGIGGISGAGQAGGSATLNNPAAVAGGIGYFLSMPGMLDMISTTSGSIVQARGGNPGTSGGASTNSTSGAGGQGGGITVIAARFITGTGVITASGGNGGNATQGNAGGGGGGAGGVIAIVTSTGSRFVSKSTANTSTLGSISLDVTGGTGGTGIGTGVAGGIGVAGVISIVTI